MADEREKRREELIRRQRRRRDRRDRRRLRREQRHTPDTAPDVHEVDLDGPHMTNLAQTNPFPCQVRQIRGISHEMLHFDDVSYMLADDFRTVVAAYGAQPTLPPRYPNPFYDPGLVLPDPHHERADTDLQNGLSDEYLDRILRETAEAVGNGRVPPILAHDTHPPDAMTAVSMGASLTPREERAYGPSPLVSAARDMLRAHIVNNVSEQMDQRFIEAANAAALFSATGIPGSFIDDGMAPGFQTEDPGALERWRQEVENYYGDALIDAIHELRDRLNDNSRPADLHQILPQPLPASWDYSLSTEEIESNRFVFPDDWNSADSERITIATGPARFDSIGSFKTEARRVSDLEYDYAVYPVYIAPDRLNNVPDAEQFAIAMYLRMVEGLESIEDDLSTIEVMKLRAVLEASITEARRIARSDDCYDVAPFDKSIENGAFWTFWPAFNRLVLYLTGAREDWRQYTLRLARAALRQRPHLAIQNPRATVNFSVTVEE